MFKTWAPLVIAKIGDLPDTLADRSIAILMRRKAPRDAVSASARTELRRDHSQRKIARYVKDNVESIRECEPSIPTSLNDRAADNWRPLLAIADTIGGSCSNHCSRSCGDTDGKPGRMNQPDPCSSPIFVSCLTNEV